MFRAVICSSSGGQIVLLQHLVSSLSVNGCTVRRLRADCTVRKASNYEFMYVALETSLILLFFPNFPAFFIMIRH